MLMHIGGGMARAIVALTLAFGMLTGPALAQNIPPPPPDALVPDNFPPTVKALLDGCFKGRDSGINCTLRISMPAISTLQYEREAGDKQEVCYVGPRGQVGYPTIVVNILQWLEVHRETWGLAPGAGIYAALKGLYPCK